MRKKGDYEPEGPVMLDACLKASLDGVLVWMPGPSGERALAAGLKKSKEDDTVPLGETSPFARCSKS